MFQGFQSIIGKSLNGSKMQGFLRRWNQRTVIKDKNEPKIKMGKRFDLPPIKKVKKN
jgi:hypothetical protein